MPRSSRTAPVLGGLAFVVASAAVVFSATGVSIGNGSLRATATPQPDRVLRLDRSKRFSPDAIPTVARARTTARLGRLTEGRARNRCSASTVNLGTWCLDKSARGTATYAAAGRQCEAVGGYLPTAAELIGAARRVRLSGRLDDHPSMAQIDPAGHDRRELSADLLTTTTGSAAAGSTANPAPTTLQAITVHDNRNQGGFAGGISVAQPERFRCAYVKRQTGPLAAQRVTVRTVKGRSARRISATVRTPVKGRLTVLATVKSGKRTIVVGHGTSVARKAGDRRVTVKPTAASRSRLRPGRRVHVTLRVSLRPSSGPPIERTTTQRVRFPRS